MNNLWFFAFAALCSWLLTGGFRRYALAKQIMDIPNARSSHSIPTPRGGGVAIVLVFLSGLWVLKYTASLSNPMLYGLLGAGGSVAVLGYLDDRSPISARWRLLGHFCASAWGLWCLGGMPPLVVLGASLPSASFLGQLLAVVYLVWLLNLYNFMDGIDGLAGIEALSACLGGFLLLYAHGQADGTPLILLAMAVLGFLVWNFPPAKIFMGDAGSGFLGMVLGLFSVQAAHVDPAFFWSWLILLGVFIVDATWTLMRRFARCEKVYQAHRSHAYQVAARSFGSHKTVSLAIAAINLCWLLPIALWVGLFGLNALLGLVLAYTPLLGLAVYFRAGANASA